MGGECIFPLQASYHENFSGREISNILSTPFQPVYGQSANIFGRRWLIILAVALFILGSAISGGARDMPMLIAGRTVQGIGGGGCSMMIDMIISDLVPLRDRGVVMGYIFGAATICTALGPFIGGVLVKTTTCRWVFYVNIPVASAGLILLLFFLHVEYDKKTTFIEKIKRVDFAGNFIFVAGTISLLIALTNAGTLYAWSNWRIILPLVLGFTVLSVFCLFEMSRWCPEPNLPGRLFTNRTPATAFALTFLHMMFLYWEVYFLPVYFQAIKQSSPARSGVQLLPTVINLMVFAGVGGAAMKATGRYLPTHAAGFALMTIGFGMFTLLKESSPTAAWVIFQNIFGAGAGLPIGTLLPAVQAEAYEHVTKDFVACLAPVGTRTQVIGAYQLSLERTWQVAIALCGLGCVLVFLQREVTLRTELDTELGLTDGRKEKPREKA